VTHVFSQGLREMDSSFQECVVNAIRFVFPPFLKRGAGGILKNSPAQCESLLSHLIPIAKGEAKQGYTVIFRSISGLRHSLFRRKDDHFLSTVYDNLICQHN